jgi:GTPase
VDHVAWYDAATLCELGERHGLTLVRHTGIASKHPTTFNAHVLNFLTPALIKIGFSPTLFAKSVIYEFVKMKPATE